jgi:hypothetical protein
MTDQSARRGAGIAALIVGVIALLLAATAVFILFVPVSASDFEAATGVDWEAFSSANPDAASYLTREARVLAVGFAGFSLLAGVQALGPLRRGDTSAGRTLWLFPVTLFGVAVVFLSSGGGTLGGTYLVAGFVTAVALNAARRERRRGGLPEAGRMPIGASRLFSITGGLGLVFFLPTAVFTALVGIRPDEYVGVDLGGGFIQDNFDNPAFILFAAVFGVIGGLELVAARWLKRHQRRGTVLAWALLAPGTALSVGFMLPIWLVLNPIKAILLLATSRNMPDLSRAPERSAIAGRKQ